MKAGGEPMDRTDDTSDGTPRHPFAHALGIWLMVIAAGLLLGASHFWPTLAPLQVVGMGALLAVLPGLSRWRAPAAGAVFGAAMSIPLLLVVRLPVTISAAYLAWFLVLYALFAGGARLLDRLDSWCWPLAAGAWLCLIETLNVHGLPLFGTAQSLARPWSAYPHLLAYTPWFGNGLLPFLVGLLAGGLALRLRGRGRGALVAPLILLALWALGPRLTPDPYAGRTVRVAALGWDTARLSAALELPRQMEAAAALGAEIIVAPETVLSVSTPAQRTAWIESWRRWASERAVAVVIGFFDHDTNRNRALLIPSVGGLIPRADGSPRLYDKTHLVPVLERYDPGDGALAVIDDDLGRWSALICQDDNFTDLSGALAARGIRLLAIPTNDWEAVKHLHLQNTRHRAAETRALVVRAATHGISAIIGPDGTLIAGRDHLAPPTPGVQPVQGRIAPAGETPAERIVVADVRLGRGGAWLARYTPWPMVGLSLLLLLLTGLLGRAPAPPPPADRPAAPPPVVLPEGSIAPPIPGPDPAPGPRL